MIRSRFTLSRRRVLYVLKDGDDGLTFNQIDCKISSLAVEEKKAV